MERKRKIKVAFVIGAMRIGGSEAQLANLLCNLPEHIEPVLITMKKGFAWDNAVGSNVMHIVAGRSSRIPGMSLLLSFVSLVRVLRKIKPDLVQSHLAGTNIITSYACKYLRIPHLLMEEGMGVTRPRWERLLRRNAYRYPCCFVCNSQAIFKRMVSREKVNPSKITIVRNALTVSALVNREEARSILGITEDCFVVFTAASLKPVKGIDFLLKGFREFTENYSGSPLLLIAGDGPYREEYESLAEKLNVDGAVRFAGLRDDVPVFMAAADVYVSSSLSEGLSNSIIEAMYFLTPVIATDTGGTSVLLRGKDFGTLIRPADSGEIANSLAILAAKGPDTNTLQKAREFVSSEFSTERVVSQFLDLYERVVIA